MQINEDTSAFEMGEYGDKCVVLMAVNAETERGEHEGLYTSLYALSGGLVPITALSSVTELD